MARVVVVVVVVVEKKTEEACLAEKGKVRRREDLEAEWQRRGAMNMGTSRDGVITQTETLMGGGASDEGELLETTTTTTLGTAQHTYDCPR